MNKMLSICKRRVAIFLVLLLAVFNAYAVSNSAHAAESQADIVLTLAAPTQAKAMSNFEYTASVLNQGPLPAHGTTFTLFFDEGTSNVALECDLTVAKKACPTDVKVLPAATEGTYPSITGRLDFLPVNGRVDFKITGTFPNATSASVTFAAELPGDMADLTPQTNRVYQQIALTDKVTPSVVVSSKKEFENPVLGESHTYTVTYENVGNIEAEVVVSDGFSAPAHRTGPVGVPISYTYECDPVASTMSCPNLSGRGNGIGNSERFWEQLVQIPAGKKFVMKLTVRLEPYACEENEGVYEMTHYAHVELAPQRNFADGSRIRVAENKDEIYLPACVIPTVEVTSSQDKEFFALGETRAYTVTYENVGDVDAHVQIFDKIDFQEKGRGTYYSVSLPYAYSYHCDSSLSTMDCSNLHKSVEGYDSGNYAEEVVVIPSGKKIVIRFLLTIDQRACAAREGVVEIINNMWGNILIPRYGTSGLSTNTTELIGQIRVPTCSQPSVTVSTTQDKEVTGANETRTYTTVYENTGDIDAEVEIVGHVRFWMGNLGYEFPHEYTYACDPELSTMKCPNLSDSGSDVKYGFGWREPLVIPARKKIVMKSTLKFLPAACDYLTEDMKIHYEAHAITQSLTPFASGSHRNDAELLTGFLECSDISTTTSLSVDSLQPGDYVKVKTTVSNSLGVAQNVPFAIHLGVDGQSEQKNNFLETSSQDVSCLVGNGSGICPTDFIYDPVNNVVKGIIPELPAGSDVTIVVNARLGSGSKYASSYVVYAETPSIRGDHARGTEDTNRSAATFRFAGKTISGTPNSPVVKVPNSIYVPNINASTPNSYTAGDASQSIAGKSPIQNIASADSTVSSSETPQSSAENVETKENTSKKTTRSLASTGIRVPIQFEGILFGLGVIFIAVYRKMRRTS